MNATGDARPHRRGLLDRVLIALYGVVLVVCAAYLWYQAARVVVADDIAVERAVAATIALALAAAAVTLMLWSAYERFTGAGMGGGTAVVRRAGRVSLALAALGILLGALVAIDLAVLLVSALMPAAIAAYLLSQVRSARGHDAARGSDGARGHNAARAAGESIAPAFEDGPGGEHDGAEATRGGFSPRRVALVVSVCGALLFSAGLVADLVRSSAYREFFITSDVSVVVLFASAAVYLRWGDVVAGRLAGRVAGRCVQVWAVLAILGQSLVWLRVARRGDVWWALAFIAPVLVAAGIAFATVHVVLRDRSTVAQGDAEGRDTDERVAGGRDTDGRVADVRDADDASVPGDPMAREAER